MYEHGILASHLHTQLADGLEKGQRLDVTYRSPDLDQCDICAVTTNPDAFLDFVGNVWSPRRSLRITWS